MPIFFVDYSGTTLNASPDADTITGPGSRNAVNGGAGNDIIDVGVFSTVHGGLGDDRIVASNTGLNFGDEGHDTITGRTDEVVNLIEGGPGNDVLTGDPDGSAFLSYAIYLGAAAGVRVDLAVTGPQDVGGGMGVDTLFGFNGLVGSAYNDTLAGSGALIGGFGDDLLQAGVFGASFDGGPGDDTLVGSAANDSVVFGRSGGLGTAQDIGLGPTRVTGSLTVDLRITGPQAIGGGMGVDTLVSVENVTGGAYADTLTGTDGANIMSGDGGNDLVSGLGGDDILNDIDGFDTLLGGDGDDWIGKARGGGQLRGGAGDDELFGGEGRDDAHGNQGADTVVGGDAADWVRGGQGNDTLDAGAGDDFVSGDRGDDTLAGGAGADLFHTFAEAGLDRVVDFNIGQGDRVLLLPGATYTASQVGADVVVQTGPGAQLVLVGVTLSSLPAGWILGS